MENRGRTISAAFGEIRSCRTEALWQWDRGQLLQISGIQLPEAWEAHVSNGGKAAAERYIGSGDTLAIDDKFLESGAPVTVWIYLHETEDDGETEYVITIPVRRRPEPEDAEPSPEQEDIIAQAITALNEAVESTGADAQAAAESASAAAESATAAAGSATAAAESATAAAGSADAAAGIKEAIDQEIADAPKHLRKDATRLQALDTVVTPAEEITVDGETVQVMPYSLELDGYEPYNGPWNALKADDILCIKPTADFVAPAGYMNLYLAVGLRTGSMFSVKYLRIDNQRAVHWPEGTLLFKKDQVYTFRHTGRQDSGTRPFELVEILDYNTAQNDVAGKSAGTAIQAAQTAGSAAETAGQAASAAGAAAGAAAGSATAAAGSATDAATSATDAAGAAERAAVIKDEIEQAIAQEPDLVAHGAEAFKRMLLSQNMLQIESYTDEIGGETVTVYPWGLTFGELEENDAYVLQALKAGDVIAVKPAEDFLAPEWYESEPIQDIYIDVYLEYRYALVRPGRPTTTYHKGIRVGNMSQIRYKTGTKLFEQGRDYLLRVTGEEDENGRMIADILDWSTAETDLAKSAALEAEKITYGTENGVPVPSTDRHYENNAEYFATQLSAIYSDVTIAEKLLRDEIPGTSKAVTFDSFDNPTSITHSKNGATVRTDTFTWGAETVTEVRTLSSGEHITIITNLTTLAQTISEVEVA